jgi:hypothetical protein
VKEKSDKAQMSTMILQFMWYAKAWHIVIDKILLSDVTAGALTDVMGSVSEISWRRGLVIRPQKHQSYHYYY